MNLPKEITDKFGSKSSILHDLFLRVNDFESVKDLISLLNDNEDYLSDEVGIWHSEDKDTIIIDLPFSGSPTGMYKIEIEKKFFLEILDHYMKLSNNRE